MMFSLSFLKMTFADISPSSVRNKTEAFISVLLPRKLQRGEGVAFTHRRWHGQSVFGPRGDQDSAPPPPFRLLSRTLAFHLPYRPLRSSHRVCF